MVILQRLDRVALSVADPPPCNSITRQYQPISDSPQFVNQTTDPVNAIGLIGKSKEDDNKPNALINHNAVCRAAPGYAKSAKKYASLTIEDYGL